MEVVIWGARGSVPVASQDTVRFGGNTTCIEVRTDAKDCIILDAGTGIRALGNQLLKTDRKKCALCFTHAHWDHVQGLPFFAPFYRKEWEIDLYGSHDLGQGGVQKTVDYIFNGLNFPIKADSTGATTKIVDFAPGESFRIGSALLETCPVRHPGGGVAYRITADGWSFVFTGDHECRCGEKNSPEDEALAAFIKGADVVLADGQYTEEEYADHVGWGHSSIECWLDMAGGAGVKRLIFTHHDADRTDTDLKYLNEQIRQRFSHLPLICDFANEGMRITKTSVENRVLTDEALSCWLCDFNQELSRYNDVGMILDSVLAEARRVTRSDAGTVYLTEGDELVFAYTQNDSLFPGSAAMRHVYKNARIPIDTFSIAGYAASTKKALKIDDVRHLPSGYPYRFNDSLDNTTGYRTVSMLTVPLIMNDRVMGVLQLINHINDSGIPSPFTLDMEVKAGCLANITVSALERGLMARELILRMLAITELRDPYETGAHVRRVGAMAAEIYHRWAEWQGIDNNELRRVKDHIHLAAMLHDVGKMGIPDAILKKPGRLTPEEREIIEQHCVMGARLFTNTVWEVDAMAREIALHHHQKWDGTGYTGEAGKQPLAGKDIPLAARITALADVYDALRSRRCYKEGYSRDHALDIVMQGRGNHFDPDVLDAFLDIVDVMEAIHNRYPDEGIYG